MPEQAESSTGKMRERSMEDTITDRPITSVLTLFPLPHQMGAPFFDEKDISDFILQWEDLTIDWLNGPHIKKVPLYCEKIIGKYVKTLGTYIRGNNWEGFVAELKSEFKDDDSEQQCNTEAFLQNMVQQMRQQQQDPSLSEYRSFIFVYAERSSLLVQKSVISAHTWVFMFLQAFSDRIGDKLCKRCNIDIDEPATTTNVWNTLKTEALKICTREDSQMNKLWKSKMSEKALPRPERKQKPEVMKSNKPESMDEVTKMMKELQIRQLEAQKRMDEELALMRDAYKTQRPSPYYLPRQYGNREYLPQPQPQTAWNRVWGYFWDGGNHRKEDCEDLRKAVERGNVHIRDRWIYLGQQGVGDTVLVPIPQEIEGKMKWQKD